MRRPIAIALASALLFGLASPALADFPTPAPVPTVPSGGGDGVNGPDWAYCYVSQAGVAIPPFTPTPLCALTVGPGTWRFNATVSTLITQVPNRGPLVVYSIDFHKQGGGPGDYYGASSGSLFTPTGAPISALGIGSFTEKTGIELRYFSTGTTSLIASASFDSGPTTLFIAERISESTAPLP